MFSKRSLAALLCAVVIPGCDAFQTRTPEPPGSATTQFDQPTSELVVVSNLQSALKQKNTEAFLLCLADTTQGFAAWQQYRFEPSAEAGARFSEKFAAWSRLDERQALLALFSRLGTDQAPILTLSDAHFDVRLPDSAVYVATYTLELPIALPSVPTRVAGTLRWTIVPNRFGLWAIARWRDAPSPASDTIPDTWSTLKALLVN
ncbi:hypothetical protein HRbin20_01812 [bacterium HR20]|jgi:hypothetical protein|nr:hypothetical protein HRbin20_01812 [bacterium HR20]GIV49695.1 MAG: hypothetical protein KatS3mg038_0216 [Candidatus Kapabacteria bacterium]